MLDHVDVSHGADENVDLWGGATDITVQWSVIAFPLYDSGHPEADHGYGLINGPGGGRVSIHHNLFAHDARRTPALAWGPAEVRNNVVYDVREGFVHHNPADGVFNIAGNSYVAGPSAALVPFWFDPENCDEVETQYWLWDNWVEDPGRFRGRVDDPFQATGFDYGFYDEACLDASHFNQAGEFSFAVYPGHVPVTAQAAGEAYEAVLAWAGAWPRDAVTRQAVADTRGRAGGWREPAPTGWLDGLTPARPPADSDGDGMPDAWESEQGLDPFDGADAGSVMPSGYTAIEEYINERAATLLP